MKRIIKYYLYFLPFYSLIGIVLSISRSVYNVSYTEYFLGVGFVFDLLIILFSFRYVWSKTVIVICILLYCSFIVGLFNGNEISRRLITDFTNPFFFFAKIYVFKFYWARYSFSFFNTYYKSVAVVGSIVLLPITYFVYNSEGATRLAIFPPMELPFANSLSSMSVLFLLSLIVILLYGKRAQLVAAFVTFLVYLFFFKRAEFLKYSFILCLAALLIVSIVLHYSDNLAVKRLTYTYDLFTDKSEENVLDRASSGRLTEAEVIISSMDEFDYLTGKGLGFSYEIDLGRKLKVAANAHFTPLGFLSKYGIIFTIFIYMFLLSIFIKSKKRLFYDAHYGIAFAVSFFVFIESFFSYGMFVTPIFPVVLGLLLCKQDRLQVLLERKRFYTAHTLTPI